MKISECMSGRDSTAIRYLYIIVGSIIYSLGLRVFITPHNLYTGGVMGFAQILRSALVMYTSVSIPEGFDVSGIIYYVINLPLLILAYKSISKVFFLKTLVATTVITVLTSIIPITSPIISDRLTSCVVGGIIVGVGIGLTLKFGGSGGGFDIVGMYLTKRYSDVSVGKVNLIWNICLYLICAFMFNIETAVYSIIYSAVNSFTLDRMHDQNIMMRAMIFTKVDGISETIMGELHRGVTEWQGDGAYTHENEHILVTIISKYEMISLRRIVIEADPHAFITYDRISGIDGNFQKRLQA